MKETKENIEQNNTFNNDRLNHYKYCLDLVNSWITNADNKISIACGLFSIIFAILTFVLERILNYINFTNKPDCCVMLLFNLNVTLVLTSFIIAIVFYFLALNPSLFSKNQIGKTEKYCMFYGDISLLSIDEFCQCSNEATAKDYEKEILYETHINSNICTKKMRNFKKGMIFSFITVALVLLGFLIYCLAHLI